MDGFNARAVEYLLATGGTWCRYEHRYLFAHRGNSLSYCWEKYHLTDGERGLVMLFLIAERAGHTAATTCYAVDGGTS